MSRSLRSQPSSGATLRVVVLLGAFATVFVLGVLVGQHVLPRSVSDGFLAASLEDAEESEEILAPRAERTLTFYDSLDAGEGRAPRSPHDRPVETDEEPALDAAVPPETRTLERRPEEHERSGSGAVPPPAHASEPRVLARVPAERTGDPPPADSEGGEGGGGEQHVQREPGRSVVTRDVADGIVPAVPEVDEVAVASNGSTDPGRDEASHDAPTADETPAESGRVAVGGSSARVVRRAPAVSAGTLEGEVASAPSLEEARQLQRILESEGLSVALITVDDPELGRRVALLLRGGSEDERTRARSVLAGRSE